MERTSLPELKPAVLMRRMKTHAATGVQRLSMSDADPILRCDVEVARGALTLELESVPEGASIQWTQNGVAIKGQTGPSVHLAGLTADDADVYFARIKSPAGDRRSQSALVVVWPGVPLLNFSTRGNVSPGLPLTAGFVIQRVAGPTQHKKYLIRVIGPSLRKFGVTAPLLHPQVTLTRRTTPVPDLMRPNDAGLAALQQKVGAFALDEGSGDFAAVAELPAGPYSITVTGAVGESGEVLIEFYETPA